MARSSAPKYQMSSFKRSPFDDLLKTAMIDDFDLDTPPPSLNVVRFGTYKLSEQNGSFAEYKCPGSKTRLRLVL